MGNTDNAVRDRIKQICKNKNYTVNKLATMSAINYSTVRDFMNGKKTT